jgi:predicted nucleic acid-binding protein
MDGTAPAWLEVRTPSRALVLAGLDQGERDAIAIAKEIGAERRIMDDRRGHREARRRGIQTMGTLAVLPSAAAAGLLDLELAIQRLQLTSFFVSPSLLARLLKK